MAVDRQLILDVYDTIVEPTKWTDVLDRLAHIVGASGLIMFNMDSDEAEDTPLVPTYITSNYDAKMVADYLKTYSRLETADQLVFARYSAAGDEIEAIPDSVLALSPAEQAARPNIQALAGMGIEHRAGALLSKDLPLRNRFSIQFSRHHGPLGPDDAKILGQVLPHMAKACEIALPMRQLERQGELLAESLNRLRLGVCLIRADRSVVAQNEEFRRQLEEIRLFRVTPSGKLEPTTIEDRGWFAGDDRRRASSRQVRRTSPQGSIGRAINR